MGDKCAESGPRGDGSRRPGTACGARIPDLRPPRGRPGGPGRRPRDGWSARPAFASEPDPVNRAMAFIVTSWDRAMALILASSGVTHPESLRREGPPVSGVALLDS